MMRMQTYFFVLFAWLALVCDSTQAQSSSTENPCTQIEDDAARLACFDRAFQPADESEELLETAQSGDIRANDVPQSSRAEVDTEGVGEVDVAPAVSTAVAREAKVEPAPVETFGAARKDPPPVAPTELSGIVSRVTQRARGQHVVHLENGQVWQENFASRYFPVDPGDTVVIKKRRFGGYRLVTESGKGFRVERVQ